MFELADVSGLSPTIVETVSVDVDEFSDSFLTCGTCLQVYDGARRSPKLLPCSHTVCLVCAQVIADASASTRPRCPVCSALFTMPAAGPTALPPSFIVNQLLDVMSSGSRRDIVPVCAEHLSSELLFCETCDIVFCTECDRQDGSVCHSSLTLMSSSTAHNVLPFAIAIRRVSEILQYKANQCLKNLDAAATAVELEMRRVDDEAECCIESVRQAFSELTCGLQHRQQHIISTVHSYCNEKMTVLQEQLALISAERHGTETQCQRLPPDVRAITIRISKLNELLDTSVFLGEPRENAYIDFIQTGNEHLHNAVSNFGAIRTSETFPALCTVEFTEPHIVVNIVSKAHILTYDASGCRRTVGGDPVSVELWDSYNKSVPVVTLDVGDGTYEVIFTALTAGTHTLTVRIFNRVVGSSCPVTFTVNQYHDAVKVFRGLHQPIAVAVDTESMYVLDTANSRVTIYDTQQSSVSRCIVSDCLSQRAATGMSLTCSQSSLHVVNWRTRRVSRLSTDTGSTLHSFDCDEFIEPTSLSVDNDDGTIFVADNGAHAIFVFTLCGQLMRKIELMDSGSSRSDLITCIYAVSFRQELLVCDHRVRAFSYIGEFLYELPAGDSKGRGQYGGVVVDGNGRYLVSRSERGRALIQVFANDRHWMYSIECETRSRLRRPAGLDVNNDGHVFVADLGNNCVRQFRYL